ncbi:MAG: hypothetical protein KUG79_10580 [Pseudomonadales bacterium]|nr:hypothetical protein [Pseudomonadales bacterium]
MNLNFIKASDASAGRGPNAQPRMRNKYSAGGTNKSCEMCRATRLLLSISIVIIVFTVITLDFLKTGI